MSRAPRDRQPAATASSQDLVVLEGGTRGGVRVRGELRGAAWYTADDWARQLACAEWSRKTHGYPADHPSLWPLGFEATTEWVEHPRPAEWPQGGTVWKWRRRPVDE